MRLVKFKKGGGWFPDYGVVDNYGGFYECNGFRWTSEEDIARFCRMSKRRASRLVELLDVSYEEVVDDA